MRDDCPTCRSLIDEEGRLPIGFCGPDCLGRRERDRRLSERRISPDVSDKPRQCRRCRSWSYLPRQYCRRCGYVLPGDRSAS